jgi:hypothetical protein
VKEAALSLEVNDGKNTGGKLESEVNCTFNK